MNSKVLSAALLSAAVGLTTACGEQAISAGDGDYENYAGDGDGDGDGDGNTNVAFGGAQDLGYFRALLNDGQVPRPGDFDAAGFFAEHHTTLPEPDCGQRICLQPMVGATGAMAGTGDCVMMQLGLNSPITLDDAERPPLTLGVVVDTSGSMAAANKIEFVDDALNLLVDELYDTDRLAIIRYSSDVEVLVPPTDVGGNRSLFRDAIEELRADGGTNLYAGLEKGYETLAAEYDPTRQNRLILLSDGQASTGITGTDQILNMSAAHNSDGIGLTTVGLGTGFNVELMRGLSEQADGNFYFVEDPAAVNEVFTEELAYFTLPIGFDLKLTMTTGEDYTFGRAVGAPTWVDTATGGELELASVFLAHRVSANDVTEEGGRRGGGSALLIELMPREDDGSDIGHGKMAVAELSYFDPFLGETVEQTIPVRYPFAPWDVQATGFFDNRQVEKSFVMLNLFVALEEATQTFHSGVDMGDALQMLELVIAAAADYEDSANDGEGDLDIIGDIELLQQLSDVIELNGVSAEPADIPDDPWPCD